MRDPKRIRSLAVAGLAAALLAACGGGDSGNGEAAKKGPQVATDAANALEQSGAAHAKGSVSSGGQPGELDLQLQGSDVSGTITMQGQAIKVVSTGGKTYIQAPASLYTAQSIPDAVASQLAGKWVIVPESAASDFSTFTLKGLADELRKPSEGTINDKVTTATVDGQKVVVVTESDGSTLNVASTGTPYPLKVENKGSSDAGTITFSDFGTKQSITAPAGALDLSTLSGG
jgi:hypothetical protein